jgi:FKBP-type peptidyl-prolyl cis-trans isomerase (trigger factor)
LSFVLDKIASERKILVTETEIRTEIAAIAARYQKTPQEMEDYMERNRLVPALRAELRDRKTLAAAKKLVKVVDAAPEAKS